MGERLASPSRLAPTLEPAKSSIEIIWNIAREKKNGQQACGKGKCAKIHYANLSSAISRSDVSGLQS